MALFEYKAYDPSGAKFTEQIEAASEAEALDAIKKLGVIPYELNSVDTKRSQSLFSSNKVSTADLEFLTSELSLLLESGVRIDKGIDIIKKTKAKPALARLLSELSNDIRKGISLSEAVKKHEDVFDPLYCNLIELGEASGNLSEIFDGLAKDLSFRRELQRKIVSSLTYPFVIFLVCLLSIFFVFNFIIPKMSSMFDGVDDLPWYTSMLLGTSEWVVANQLFIILGTLLLGVGLSFAIKKPSFVQWWQKVSLKLPVFRTTVLTLERIRFNTGLAMMIKSGVPIDQSLQLSAGNVKNHIIKRELDIVRNKIKSGSLLTPALKQTSLYPDFYVSLLEVGEESGKLERVFNEISKRSKQEFESWTERVTTLLEPLMIVFMGGFVGGVVVVMLLSMVTLNEIGI